jgi:hypothetical protein
VRQSDAKAHSTQKAYRAGGDAVCRTPDRFPERKKKMPEQVRHFIDF